MQSAPRITSILCLLTAIVGSLLSGCALPDRRVTPTTMPHEPVLRADFPDPFILPHENHFLAYATNTAKGQINVQMAESRDLKSWQRIEDPQHPARLHDAMPALPAWAKRGYTWAPEVLNVEDRFVLYFTARHAKSGLQCVGAATSLDPRGPFESHESEPLVCQFELGGTIDASPFRDADGQLYLYFKNDGNHRHFNKPTEVFAQRLSPDGLSLLDHPVPLLRNDTAWEGRVIEAPTMIRRGSSYVLFYSANDFGWRKLERASRYAVGYANCKGPLGPCADATGNPFLASQSKPPACLSGPGHQAIFQSEGITFIAFHAWSTTRNCRPDQPKRFMYIAPLILQGGMPELRRKQSLDEGKAHETLSSISWRFPRFGRRG